MKRFNEIIMVIGLFFVFQTKAYSESIVKLKKQGYVDPYDYGRPILGFNANTFLGQIIPFNKLLSNTGDPSLTLRQNFGKYGYRVGIGIIADPVTFETNSVNFNLGYCKQISLDKRFNYITGLELKVVSMSNSRAFVGISRYWGVEYKFNSIVSVSTEMSFRVGASVVGSGISLNPPMSFICHFRL